MQEAIWEEIRGWGMGAEAPGREGGRLVGLLSRVRLSVAPWTVARQAPLSIEVFRQEYWSERPFPSLGDLLDLGIEPASLVFPALADGFFTASATSEAHGRWSCVQSRWLPGAVHLQGLGGSGLVGKELGVYLPAGPCGGSFQPTGNVGGAGTASEKIAFMVLIPRIPILEQQTSAHILSWPFPGSVTLFASLGCSFPIAQKGNSSLVLPG